VPAGAPDKSGNTALKIILGVVAFFLLVTLLGIGSCVYIGYRVSRKAREYTRNANLGPPARVRDACSLVTKEEVGDALGTTISEANGGTAGCRYTVSAGNNQALGIQVTWQGGALAMNIAGMALRGVAGSVGSFQPVAGIGDEAYVGPLGSTMMFRKGDVMVNMDLRMAGNNVDAAKAIAQKILSRL
jgi:hypothetical protein